MNNQRNLIIGGIIAIVLLVLLVASAGAVKPDPEHKVTICHRTNSVNNPYNQIEVDADSADGDTGNDNGKGDHSEHTGPVVSSEAEAQELKDSKQKWGDIIPPHDNYAGLNWDQEGQAVYNNDCKYTSREEPPEEPEEPETPDLSENGTPKVSPPTNVEQVEGK